MSEFHAKLYEARGQRTVAALKKNGFDALYIPTAALAAEKVLEFVHAGAKVGFGGSFTVKSMNIQELAASRGAVILDHNKPGLGAEEKTEILRAQLTCDLFISSANAITMEGFLFNVDGNGNRVAALSFGPKKNVVVAGINKVVANLDEAYERRERSSSPHEKEDAHRTAAHIDDASAEYEKKPYKIHQRLPPKNSVRIFADGDAAAAARKVCGASALLGAVVPLKTTIA